MGCKATPPQLRVLEWVFLCNRKQEVCKTKLSDWWDVGLTLSNPASAPVHCVRWSEQWSELCEAFVGAKFLLLPVPGFILSPLSAENSRRDSNCFRCVRFSFLVSDRRGAVSLWSVFTCSRSVISPQSSFVQPCWVKMPMSKNTNINGIEVGARVSVKLIVF